MSAARHRNGATLCNGKGDTCRAIAVKGSDKCRNHGGESTGPKTMTAGGRYSKFIPKQLAAKYEEALADAELISVRDEAALVQTFLADSLESIDKDHCEAMWETLQVLCNMPLQEEDLNNWSHQIKNVVRDGVEEWRKVQRALGYVEVKRKLAETEAKRMKDLGAMLNAKEANALIGALLGIINKQVPDHNVRSRIASDLAALVHTAA